MTKKELIRQVDELTNRPDALTFTAEACKLLLVYINDEEIARAYVRAADIIIDRAKRMASVL